MQLPLPPLIRFYFRSTGTCNLNPADNEPEISGTAFFTVLAILGSKDQPQRMRIVQVSTVFKNCNSDYFWRMRVLHARLKLQRLWKALYVDNQPEIFMLLLGIRMRIFASR